MAEKQSSLTWDVPPTGGSDITGYRVLLVESDGDISATLTSITPTTTVSHSPVADRTAVIQARNALGLSAPLTFTVPQAPEVAEPGVLSAPTISAVPGNARVTLTATGGNYDYLHWIRIQVDLASRGGTVSPYVDTTLANNVDYSYHALVSLNGSAEISSNVVTVTPREVPLPTFTAVRSSTDPRSLVVTLTSALDPRITAVQVRSGNTSYFSADTSFPRTVENVPTDAFDVYLRCSFTASNGLTGTSDTPTVSVPAYVAGDVGTPPTFSVYPLNEAALIVPNDDGVDFTYYRVRLFSGGQYAGGQQTGPVSAFNPGLVYFGLTNDAPIDIELSATDSAATTFVVGQTVTVTPSATGTPTAPAIQATAGDGEITVTQVTPGTNIDSLSAGYYDSTDPSDDQDLIPNITLPYTFTGLINGHNYSVAIYGVLYDTPVVGAGLQDLIPSDGTPPPGDGGGAAS